MNSLPEQVFVDILKTQMSLGDNQIWIREQNKLIPDGTGLFVVVGMVDSKPYSSTNTPTSTADGISEIIQVISRDNIQIDLFSRDTSAIFRRWEILAALNSVYSEQQQEDNSFKIFKLPTSFVNTSAAEGGSNINRFSIIIACHAWYTKENALLSPNDYYDDFTTRADDEKTISNTNGLIEFEITETNLLITDLEDFIITDEDSYITAA